MNTEKIKNHKQGFTLLELLVVVLIIGILTAIALPQYKMAVTKAKVVSILPLMRRWKDALMEYKLQHGSYCEEGQDGDCDEFPDADTLGVNWPSDWIVGGDEEVSGKNDYWDECYPNAEGTGYVYCTHDIDDNNSFVILMFQPDESIYEGVADMMICDAFGTEGEKVCKALGGKLLEEVSIWGDAAYKLN